jgi:Protein of unknown function (DUF3592)
MIGRAIACMMLRGTADDWGSLPILLGAVLIGVCAFYWRFFVQWFQGILGRNWPTVPAIIDIVSVVPIIVQGRGGQQVDGYLATLTYFYHNPELQTGDYSHMWGTDEEAQSWASSYKGSEVMVHVDPRDPSRSVLRKQELP